MINYRVGERKKKQYTNPDRKIYRDSFGCAAKRQGSKRMHNCYVAIFIFFIYHC